MQFNFEVLERDGSVTLLNAEIHSMIIAGWAGRNHEAIEHHIEELAAIGVPRPSQVQLFYRVSSLLLTQNTEVEVIGEKSSGEIEVLLFAHNGQTYITLTSDHTDRGLETVSVAYSKQVCPKPMGQQAWRFDDVLDHCDNLQIQSYIIEDGQRVTYQDGTLAALLPPTELLQKYFSSQIMQDGFAMSCGTVGTQGSIRPSKDFYMVLTDPILGRTIQHHYRMKVLPEVA